MPKSNIYRILTHELRMRQVCAKMMLTDEQEEIYVLKCRELLERRKSDRNFLNRVVTDMDFRVRSQNKKTKQRVAHEKIYLARRRSA